jgi:hypothetical protein
VPDYKHPGLTEDEYQNLTKAIDKVAISSQKLDKDVEALQALVKCCIHHGTEQKAS